MLLLTSNEQLEPESKSNNYKEKQQERKHENENANIKIHKPFRYEPYINLNAGSGFLNGRHVFPIGDSLFCGNPKVGNGLGLHLKFINSLVRKMITVNNN